MKQHTLNGFTLLAVGVPDQTGEFTVRATDHCDNGSISFYNKFTNKETTVLIPPGSYEILGRGHSVTEEQWKGLVETSTEKGQIRYRMYEHKQKRWGYDAAIFSGHSWMKSEGIDPNSLLVIKK